MRASVVPHLEPPVRTLVGVPKWLWHLGHPLGEDRGGLADLAFVSQRYNSGCSNVY